MVEGCENLKTRCGGAMIYRISRRGKYETRARGIPFSTRHNRHRRNTRVPAATRIIRVLLLTRSAAAAVSRFLPRAEKRTKKKNPRAEYYNNTRVYI